MEPRTKGTHPKPGSAFDSYLAVQRVLDLQSIPRLPMREIRSMVKGLAKQYIEEHGLEAILPHRKQPFSNRQQERLLHAIPNGAKMGKFRYLRDSYFGDTWDALNKPAQNWVRKYLIAYSKEGLGRIYGKFSGDLQVPDSQIKLDYSSLLTEGKDEKLKLVEELTQRLERLRPDKVLERKKNEAEFLNGALKYPPMQSPFNII